jgi:methionine aminopeptidase
MSFRWIAALKNGFYGDHAYSFEIGEVAPEVKKLLKVTKESLYVGIREFKSGNRVEDVGNAIQKYTESHGYGVVRELVGHGLGAKCTKIRKCRTMANAAAAKCSSKAWSSRSSR